LWTSTPGLSGSGGTALGTGIPKTGLLPRWTSCPDGRLCSLYACLGTPRTTPSKTPRRLWCIPRLPASSRGAATNHQGPQYFCGPSTKESTTWPRRHWLLRSYAPRPSRRESFTSTTSAPTALQLLPRSPSCPRSPSSTGARANTGRSWGTIMTNPASKGALGELHVIVATVLKDRLRNDELCTAADINAAIKFLKDNNIQATREANKALDELADVLENKDVSEAEEAELQAALDNIVHFPGSVANGA